MAKKTNQTLTSQYLDLLRRIDAGLDDHDERTPDEALPAIIELPKGVSGDQAESLLEQMKKDGLVTSYEYDRNEVDCRIIDAASDGYRFTRGYLRSPFWDYAVWVAPDFRERVNNLLHPNNKRIKHERLKLCYSPTFGLFIEGFPTLSFWAEKKRGQTLQLLYDQLNGDLSDIGAYSAAEIGKQIKSTEKTVLNEIPKINELFRDTFGFSEDLIVKSKKMNGYVLNTAAYFFEAVDF